MLQSFDCFSRKRFMYSNIELNTMELARFGRLGLRGGIITESRIQCGT